MAATLVLACFLVRAGSQAQILDLKHYSTVFGEGRNFRVFLPPDYERAGGKRYPVIYFFHGWHERYNRADTGYDSRDEYGGDTIAAFVGGHDVIVVKWDGYNPRTPGEDYPRPYNISLGYNLGEVASAEEELANLVAARNGACVSAVPAAGGEG